MKSRQFQPTTPTHLGPIPAAHAGLYTGAAMSTNDSEFNVIVEATINESFFKSLIHLALHTAATTPLNRNMTRLLGLSMEDEVIFSKQIGISSGDDLHGLIVSLKSGSDDVLLVKRTSEQMEIYLTDSFQRLRTAATLNREDDRPQLVATTSSLDGYRREQLVWAQLAEGKAA